MAVIDWFQRKQNKRWVYQFIFFHARNPGRNAGKNNPNYGNGDKIKGDRHPMKRPEVRAKFKGNRNSMCRPEVKEKISGDKNPAKRPEVRKKISLALIGKKVSTETREKHSMTIQGVTDKKDWKGFTSFEPYGIEFNKELKERIRKRDSYRCQECFRHENELFTKKGKKKKLFIHHIDYDKKNNNPSNLISLCPVCHLQTNYSRSDWTEYYQKEQSKRNYR